MARVAAVLVLLVLAVCTPRIAQGYVFDKTIARMPPGPKQHLGRLVNLAGRSFGFQKGGSITLRLDCDYTPGQLGLVLMSVEQYSEYRDDYDTPCNGVPLKFQRNLTLPANNSLSVTAIAGADFKPAFYEFLLRECDPFPPTNKSHPRCEAVLTVINPGGEHLSSDEIQIPGIYRVFLTLWATVVLLWFVNWFQWHQYSNHLHKVLTMGPILKLVVIALEMQRWERRSSEGTEDRQLADFRYVLTAFENAYLFALMILIAFGWCIIRFHLDQEAVLNLCIGPTVFFLSSILIHFVHEYFIGFTTIAVLLMVVFILRHSSCNMVFLLARLSEIRAYERRHPNPDGTSLSLPISWKWKLIKQSRSVFVMYAMLWALLTIVSTFLGEHSWIETLVFEIIEAVVYLAVLFFFRLRNFAAFVPAQQRQRRPRRRRRVGEQGNGDDEDQQASFALISMPAERSMIGVIVDNDLFVEYVKSLVQTGPPELDVAAGDPHGAPVAEALV
eukprot:m.487391 g.487391  ORF g.487391 m.487391 type:complete len:500 (-) comp24983_c0_seq1:147-1646(-)